MTAVQIIITILSSATTGLLIALITLRLLFTASSKKNWAGKISTLAQKEFESSIVIEEKVSDPQLFEKLKPEIERHVDLFLTEKLAAVFPLLYKFMGEKTLTQFKGAFMTETDLLFPVIIKKYILSLKKDISIDKIVLEKINSIPISQIRVAFYRNARKEILYFKLICLGTGLLTGLLSVALVLIST